VNGYSIIKYYHMITIFDTRYTFYEIEGLDSDLLVGYNLLKKTRKNAIVEYLDYQLPITQITNFKIS